MILENLSQKIWKPYAHLKGKVFVISGESTLLLTKFQDLKINPQKPDIWGLPQSSQPKSFCPTLYYTSYSYLSQAQLGSFLK